VEKDHLEHFRCVGSTIVSLYVRIISLHDIWKINIAFGCHKLGFTNVATHVRDHGINFHGQENSLCMIESRKKRGPLNLALRGYKL